MKSVRSKVLTQLRSKAWDRVYLNVPHQAQKHIQAQIWAKVSNQIRYSVTVQIWTYYDERC